jgi:diguanylate cyclase (GGDEF)-like protein/putative nucleotidyltransferase with HDIG domain
MIIIKGITPATRLSVAWVLVTVAVLVTAIMAGVLPSRQDALSQTRQNLGKALAHQLSISAQNAQGPALAAVAHTMIETNPDLWSMAVRNGNGDLVFHTASHEALWDEPRGEGAVPTHLEMPALQDGKPWGTIEVRFAPEPPFGGVADAVRLILVVGLLGFLVCRIILSDVSGRRGALARQEVTAIEQRNARLEQMVAELDTIRKQVQTENDELQLLATQDNLTDCFNRRAIFEQLDTLWHAAKRYGYALSCIMLDIDHFKSINDSHGHATGDKVLTQVSTILRARTRRADILGRYGGEEFCLLLPHTSMEQSVTVAENLRVAIGAAPIMGSKVTASFGVTTLEFGARDPKELIDQADQAMYAAKNAGRNQTARWDRLDDERCATRIMADGAEGASSTPMDMSIPYPAVLALISVLGQRDPDTAAHSRRVAELCDLTAHGLLAAGDSFMLEVAALLHDIGKIGVPDAILLKPGKLTEDERDVIRTHKRIGIEIIDSAFHCDQLANIVRHHHAFFGGTPGEPDLMKGDQLPVASRILAIADAYDSMLMDRAYRKGRTSEQAITELRRCAGSQFDPELVERFVAVLSSSEVAHVFELTVDSPEIRLQLGQAVDRLMAALQVRDMKSVSAMAERLSDVATKCRRPEIAQQATKLARIVRSGELLDVLETSAELVSLCRSFASQMKAA